MEDPILPLHLNGIHLNRPVNGHSGRMNGTTTNNGSSDQPHWKKVSAAKQLKREQALSEHQDWRLKSPVSFTVKDVSSMAVIPLTERERQIVESDATDLVNALQTRHYSALEVSVAFCKVRLYLYAASPTINPAVPFAACRRRQWHKI